MSNDTVIDATTDTMYSVMLVPDEPSLVVVQEHQTGRLRSVLWLDPAAAAELGRLLVAITLDEYDPTREMIER